MPGSTPIYGWPYGVITDGAVDLLDVGPLASAIETTVSTDPRPSGDASHSQFLTSPVSFTANDNKNILTTGAITIPRDQWVVLAGHALFANQTSGASGKIGIYIDVDAVVVPQLTTGMIWMGAAGNITEFMQLSLPAYAVFVTAGSHTFRLRGDRDSTPATHNAVGTQTQNVTHQPCSLTVII